MSPVVPPWFSRGFPWDHGRTSGDNFKNTAPGPAGANSNDAGPVDRHNNGSRVVLGVGALPPTKPLGLGEGAAVPQTHCAWGWGVGGGGPTTRGATRATRSSCPQPFWPHGLHRPAGMTEWRSLRNRGKPGWTEDDVQLVAADRRDPKAHLPATESFCVARTVWKPSVPPTALALGGGCRQFSIGTMSPGPLPLPPPVPL